MTVKETIMNKAADLFLQKGIHGTSTNAIVTAAGVSNGALFNHFANKDELVVAIYRMYKDDLRSTLINSLDAEDGIRSFIHKYWNATIQWSLNNPEKKQFIMTYALQPSVKSCMSNYDPKRYSFLISKISKAIDEQEIIAENIDYFTFIFSGATDGIVNYLNHNKEADQAQIIDKSFNQFWRSIVNF